MDSNISEIFSTLAESLQSGEFESLAALRDPIGCNLPSMMSKLSLELPSAVVETSSTSLERMLMGTMSKMSGTLVDAVGFIPSLAPRAASRATLDVVIVTEKHMSDFERKKAEEGWMPIS